MKEVTAPVEQLMAWALPQRLSPDGTVIERGINAANGKAGALEILLPSKAPTLIAMRYKGRTYGPLVIESIGQPINAPVDSNGRYVQHEVPMTLCSLSAIDRDDWVNMKKVSA